MVRQGVSVAIGRLHPDFAVKLAAAIKLARESGMMDAGVFSAYRPSAFGIGGFSDKFNSLHSYGLAADITGIGHAGSPFAHRWESIVKEVGLYLPYGADNRVEFNHTQLIPTKIAAGAWHQTITASAPKDLREMWLASGVRAYVGDDAPVKPPSFASAVGPAANLSNAGVPAEDASLRQSGAAMDAPQGPQPTRATAPRRRRARPQRRRARARTDTGLRARDPGQQ
jgi:hypothetical protein